MCLIHLQLFVYEIIEPRVLISSFSSNFVNVARRGTAMSEWPGNNTIS